MKIVSHVLLTAAIAFLAACGGRGSQEPATTPSGAPSVAPTTQAGTAVPARDISAIKACEIVGPEEVAGIVGGKLLTEPVAGFPNCSYVIEVGGGTESYRVAYSEPGALQAMVDYETATGPVERVEGLWDQAVVLPREAETGGGFSAVAIRKGDIAVEVWGERKEPVVEVLRLAASRVD